ncbi:unnamed protein product, partial [Scytosiphon promiscuus]
EGLKRILQDFSGIERTTVEYTTSMPTASSGTEDSARSAHLLLGNKGVCSNNGTTVTVTFDAVSTEGDDGDLPLLELDYMNSPMNDYTGMSWGDSHRLWYGWLNKEEEEPERAEKDISFGGYFMDDSGKAVIGDDGLNGVELGPAVQVTPGRKAADRLAVYAEGTGTDTLSFIYIVQEGDSSADLEYYDRSSLTLPNNSSIVGENGVLANLELPPLGYPAVYRLGTGASLGANKGLVIDTSPPFVMQQVDSPNEARAYGTGEVIVINVVFNQDVTLDGEPTLMLETGVFNQEIDLLSSGNKTLTFEYEVQEGDSTSDLDYASTSALNLNGGALYRSSENATTQALTALPVPGESGSLSQNEDIVVRPTTANIIDVDSSTADGEYGAGQDIYINVTFGWWDDDITPMLLMSNSAELWLRAGWRIRATVHGAVNGETQLVLEEGHELTVEDIGEEISVGSSQATLLNVTENEVEISEPYAGEDILEGIPVVNVSSSGYEPAIYHSGNGTAHFIFLYTVQQGDRSNDLDYWDEEAFRTDGYVRRAADEGATAANVSLPEPGTCVAFKGCSLGANRDLVVSTAVPRVENTTTTKPTDSGPYGAGEEIDVTVWFTEPVEVLMNVTKAPRLRMDTGNFADYAFGSGTKAITFVYTVQDGDNTEALDARDAPAYGELSALDVSYAGNFGYLRRVSTWPTTDADLTLPEPGSSGSLSGDPHSVVVVDTTVARVVAVNTSVASGVYGVGEEIMLRVTFTAAVGVNSTLLNGSLPSILLNTGGAAFYDGGNGTSTLDFLYVVGEGDNSAGESLDIAVIADDVTATATILLPVDEAIFDAVMESPAVVTLPRPGVSRRSLGSESNIIIDTEPPAIFEVTSTLVDGQYGPGHEVEILVKFTAPVVVYGVPRLWLDLGDADAYALFGGALSNNATNDTLAFIYFVQEGDSTADLDYTSPFALELSQNGTTTLDGASTANSSAILRSSTNPSQNASLTLPSNGQPGSLGFGGSIWIETTPPSISRVSTTAADGVPRGIAGRLLSADVVAEALSSANGFLNVTVTEDEPPFGDARRFVVHFDAPRFGVGALGVVDADDDCGWLRCEDGADEETDGDGIGECDESGVLVNRDASVAVQEGAIEIVLHFTADVNVNTTQGSPVLLLRVDPTNTTNVDSSSTSVLNSGVDGVRYAEHIPGLTQFVDIGVDASSPVTQGHFRLSYGGALSGCMDVNSAESAAGGYSVKSRLQELEEVNLLGIEKVTRETRGNGFRFIVMFRAGNPRAIEVPAENVTEGCLVDFDPPLEASDFSIPDTERVSFLYVLQPGDTSDGLEIAGSDALMLNGSTIRRMSTFPSQAANLTFDSGGEYSDGGTGGLYGLSLRGSSDDAGVESSTSSVADLPPVVVDCSDTPVVLNVTSTAFAGEYGAGQRIYFQVAFSRDVIVDESASPRLLLETGMVDSAATFYTGNETSVLTFRSTIQEDAFTTSLGPFSRTALTRNGGFVRSARFHTSVDAELGLPSRSENYSIDGGAIAIDTSEPQVTSVYTTKEDGVYGEGEEVALYVVYSHAMDVLGTPRLPLNSGGNAFFTLGGRRQIVSVAGDDDADFAFGIAQVTAGSFRLQYGDEITSCIGFNSSEDATSALRDLNAFSDSGIDNVTVSASKGGYNFEINFSEGDLAYESYPTALEVPWNFYEGCQAFAPANAKPARVALDTLVFLYEVQNSDAVYRLDIANTTSIEIDDASYVRRHQSRSLTDGNTSLPNEPLRVGGSNIVINTTQPVVTGVFGRHHPSHPVRHTVCFHNRTGPFGYNEEVELRVEFSLPVTVPDIAEDTAVATPTETDDAQSPGLAVVVGSTSTAKTTTYLTAVAVNTAQDLLSDAAAAAAASNVSSTHGGGGGYYNYTSVYFKYLVAAEDASLDLRYLDSSSLVGNILRLSSNPLAAADLTLPAPGLNGSLSHNADVVIDAANEETRVHNVTRTPSAGLLGIGDEATLTVHFTRKVRFTGEAPTLVLATATPYDVVSCSSPLEGSFVDSFSFTYVVSPGDSSSDLSYTDTRAFSLVSNTTAASDSSSDSITATTSGATEIVDEGGNAVNVTLPAVGSRLSSGGWRLRGARRGNRSEEQCIRRRRLMYRWMSLPSLTAHYEIMVAVVYNNEVVIFGTPLLTLRVGDAPYYERRAVYSSGSGTSVLVFEYIVELGDHTIHLDYDGTNALYLPTATEGSEWLSSMEGNDGSATFSAVRSKYDETVDADPTLPPVWSGDTLGSRVSITIAGDATPTAVSVSCPLTPGSTTASYGVGETIDLEVLFTTRVFVKNSLSLPHLLVEVGEERRGEAQASYLSGNMTDTLTFRYTVVEGDSTDAFDILDTRTTSRQRFSTALVKPSAAEVKAASDRPIVDALLFLPVPGDAGTISSGNNSIALDTEVPFVRSVAATSDDGVYSTGDTISLVCAFSQPVVVVGEGTPSIGLSLGRSDRSARAVYSGGNGTAEFELSYTVQHGDYTELLDYESADSFLLFQTWQQAMERSGAAMLRASSNPSQDVDLTLAPPGPPITVLGKFSIAAMGSRVAVQTDNVRAIAVTSSFSNGTYPEGSIIPVTVIFSVEVYVMYGIPSLSLNVRGTNVTANTTQESSQDNTTTTKTAIAAGYANYTSGNGTSELLFAYVVEAGDSTSRLDFTSPAADALFAPFGAVVAKDTLGPVYLNSLPEPGTEGSLGWNTDIVISDEVLLVDRVWTTTLEGTYGAGENIDLYVGFRFPILVESDTAFLSVNTVAGAGYPVELSGQDVAMNALVFTYTVQEGHQAYALEVASAHALNGTVRLNATYATSSINVTLPEAGEPDSLSYERTIEIDTAAPFILNATSTQPNGTYTIGAVIGVVIRFSSRVVVLASGDYPTNCTSNGSDNSSVGSGGVACEGLPVLWLDVSGENGDKNATYTSGNGTVDLVFVYEAIENTPARDMQVAEGDGSSRLDYASTSALSLGGGEILRASANPSTSADVTLPAKGAVGSVSWSSEVIVDSSAGFILDVNSTKTDGVYGIGEEIFIDVYLSTPVYVGGIPFLELNAGPDAAGLYISGGSSEGVLTFLYVVTEGDGTFDLDTDGQNSLVFPGGSFIQRATHVDDARRPMVIVLDMTADGQGSLGAQKELVIDTLPPQVLGVSSSKPNEEYGAGEEIDITVTFSYPVVVVAGTFLLVDTGEETISANAVFLSGNGSVALTFLYIVSEGDQSVDLGTFERGDAGEGGGLVGMVFRNSDNPTQEANITLPVSGEDGSLTINNDIVIDTTPPYVIAVLSLREGVYTMGQAVDLQVIYNKPVNVSGTPRVSFVLDSDSDNDTASASYATYDPLFNIGSFADEHRALSFVYVVKEDDETAHFKHAGSDALELYDNATIKRASTSPTTNALINLPAAEGGSLLDLVTKAEVIVRGLYHAAASDLDITLLHQEHSCVLSASADTTGSSSDSSSSTRPAGVQFGVPEDRRYIRGFGPNPAASTGAPSRPAYWHRGIGYDYAFADVVGENVAKHEQAVSRQSSTMFGGVSGAAVDGKLSRFFSDGSTTMTSLETEPWWQASRVSLVRPYTLGYIRLFGREEEVIKREIQTITLRSKSALGGSFTLNITDAVGSSSLTDDIYYNAVGALGEERGNGTGTGSGESLESKLEELSIITSVEVTRSSSSSSAELYQRTWTVTFVSPAGDMPQMELGSDESLTSYGNDFTFATIQHGTAAGG